MRSVIVALVAAVLTLLALYAINGIVRAHAQSDSPTAASSESADAHATIPKLEETDGLRMAKLTAERELIRETFLKKKVQQQLLQHETEKLERDYADKERTLNAVTVEAAKRAGLLPEHAWRPDFQRGVWVRKGAQ